MFAGAGVVVVLGTMLVLGAARAGAGAAIVGPLPRCWCLVLGVNVLQSCCGRLYG